LRLRWPPPEGRQEAAGQIACHSSFKGWKSFGSGKTDLPARRKRCMIGFGLHS
jgi:hypothetical protein